MAENADLFSNLKLNLGSPSSTGAAGSSLFGEMLVRSQGAQSERDAKATLLESRLARQTRQENKPTHEKNQSASTNNVRTNNNSYSGPNTERETIQNNTDNDASRVSKKTPIKTDETAQATKKAPTAPEEKNTTDEVVETNDTAEDIAEDIKATDVEDNDAEVRSDNETEESSSTDDGDQTDTVAASEIFTSTQNDENGNLLANELVSDEGALQTDHITNSPAGNDADASEADEALILDEEASETRLGDAQAPMENPQDGTEENPSITATQTNTQNTKKTQESEQVNAASTMATKATADEAPRGERASDERKGDTTHNKEMVIEEASTENAETTQDTQELSVDESGEGADVTLENSKISTNENTPALDGSEQKAGTISSKVTEHTIKTPAAQGVSSSTSSSSKVDVLPNGSLNTEQAERTQRTEAPKSTIRMANQQAMIDRIASNVRLMVGRQQSSIRMDLDPPELGKMQMRLAIKGGELTGHLRVESAEARTLITQNLDTLRNALEKEGIAVSAFTVDVNTGQKKGYENQYRAQEQSDESAPGSLKIPGNSTITTDQIMEHDKLNLIA